MLGTKGVDKIGKLAETGELVSKANAIKRAGKTVKETAKLKVKNVHGKVNQSLKTAAAGINGLFPSLGHRFAMADVLGEIPFNVINAAGLRDKVAKIADKVSSGIYSFIHSLNNGKNLFRPVVSKDTGEFAKTYKRPSGYRKGVRDKVWEKAKTADGEVKDHVTGKLMNKNEPWDMGHKPGYEFRKHQQSAQERGISRKEFLTNTII
ncbi:GH-E family nuclease [Terrilactibacillus sp. S3-3]|nr:GH-E family nuclease [Terrilactibacillus sp. S3-3]